MFIQVIQGKVGDESGLRAGLDRWAEQLLPGATGYLGTTAGITDDGTFVALARFESADAARANSERPEQGEWWAELEKNFDGEVSFLDCARVTTVLDGGSDEAGFVQIMRGKGTDVDRLQQQMAAHADEIRARRPEIIGGLLLDAGDGNWVNVFYFTDEEAAREGEQQDLPADLQAEMEESRRLAGEPTFLDLHDPILLSPPA